MLNDAMQVMLARYNAPTPEAYHVAMREILDRLILLALWRSKFFEHATLCKGSAIGLSHRYRPFSEGLSFSLLKPNLFFNMEKYNSSIEAELEAFGFHAGIELYPHIRDASIKSAFLKEKTYIQRIRVNASDEKTSPNVAPVRYDVLFEVDVEPPVQFTTQAKPLLQPVPFTITTYSESDLFADIVHVLLCHGFKNQQKIRDWCDFDVFIRRKVPLRIAYLRERLIASDLISERDGLTRNAVYLLLNDKIRNESFEELSQEASKVFFDKKQAQAWSCDYFQKLLLQMEVI